MRSYNGSEPKRIEKGDRVFQNRVITTKTNEVNAIAIEYCYRAGRKSKSCFPYELSAKVCRESISLGFQYRHLRVVWQVKSR